MPSVNAPEILKKYKRGFLDIIKKKDFDASKFSAKEVKGAGGSHCFEICLLGTPMKFKLKRAENTFDKFVYSYTIFEVGFRQSGWSLGKEGIFADISDIYSGFEKWLESEVSQYWEELTEPDVWEQLNEGYALINITTSNKDDASRFTAEEITEIRSKIIEFRSQIIIHINPSHEKLKEVEAQLKYISDALDKHNKRDWKAILLSTIITISFGLDYINAEHGRLLFDLFKQVFLGLSNNLP